MSRSHTHLTPERQSDGLTLAAETSPRTISEALPIFLRHGSPFVLLVSVVLAVTTRLSLGGWSAWDLVPALIVVAAWPIQEWLIHVFILHYKPVAIGGRTIDFRVPRKHREHHREPWNFEILFVPMHSYLYSLPLLVILWVGFMPTARLASTAIAVHLVLALHYEWIHFLIHTRVQPRLTYYRRLWRNHRLHHFKNEHYWYGVTRLEGDRLFRTAPGGSEVPLSPTCRTLYSAVVDAD